MDIDDLDSHICLHCQKHIIGLRNYVEHKKYSCPMKRHDNSNPSEKVDIEVKQENLLTDIPSSKNNIQSVARISTDLQDAACGSTTQEKECIEKVRRRVGRPRKHKPHALKNPLQSVVDCQHSKSTADPCHSISHADQPSNRNLIQAQKKSSKGVLHCQGRRKKQPLQDERKEKLERPSENEVKAEQMLQQQEAHCDQEKPEECSFGEELEVDHLEGALDKSERTIIRKVGRPYALKDHEERVHVPRRVGRPRKQSYLKNDQASSEVQHASETDKFDATTDSAVRSRRSWNTFVKSTNSDGSTTTKTSPRRRHQRYDGSDLYKPRLSFGGSRQHTQEKRNQSDTNGRKRDSLLPPRKFKRIKVDKEERMENTVNNVKPKLQTATSPNRDSADDLNHLSSISANRQSCLSNHKRQHACSSPEPEIVAVLCSLKSQCQSESRAVENPEPHDGRTDHVPVALTLVNLLNELCFEDDLKGLDYLPDLGYSDLESHGLHSSKESDGMHRITVNNGTYVLVPSCQKCNRCFINTLAYHSHLRSSQCQKEDDEVLADEEPSQASPEQLSQTRAAFKQGNMIAMELTSTESVQSLKNSGIFSEACSVCSAVFDNKYAYIRHLLHSLHLDQIQDHSVQRLILPLKLYQCHLCSFYCDDHSDFLKHMGSLEHSEVVDHITEDMFCPVCDFRTSSKKNMYLHFRSLHDQPPVLNTPVFLKEVDNPHSCQFCGKPFLSSRAVNIHIAVEPGHRKGGQHSTWCDICEKAFSTTSNLQQHLWRMHDNTKNFTCLVCHKSFSYKNNLDMHYKSQMHRDNAMMWQKSRENQSMSEDVSHSKKDISAEHKTEGLASGVTIKQEPDDTDSHTGNECDDHGSEENLFTKKPVTVLRRKRGRPRKNSSTVSSDNQLCHCELCGFKIYSLKQFQKHQQSRYHARTVEDAAKSSDCFVCSVCEHKFYCKERFALHKLAHRDKSRVTGRGIKGVNRLKGIPERFHKLALSLPKKVKSEVQCPECEGWFKANTIIPHIRCKHADGSDLPYKCNFCPLAFPSNSSLYRHHKRHVGLLSFKCTICSKGFRSKSDLESHELMIHKDELHIEAKLQCSLCGAGFMQQSKLNTHIKEKHEKLRKYWCAWPGCHRAFIHQQEYVIHMRGHTGEKPYLCDHCGFATKSKVQLARHERIHMNVANYKCKYCPYTSRMSAGLRRHMRLHTGAKPYKCPHCEHRCYSHTNLRLHINNSRLHPSLKLYNCHYCQFATNATTEFLNHMFEAHSLRPEVIGNVAEYCGVYLPKEDITEVKEGCMPIQLTKRKPRCKVSSRIKPSEEAMSEQEIVLEQDEVERTVSMNDESLVDQSNVHQGLHENKIISYHQISGEKAQKIVNKHNDQQYNVLSILKTPGGKIMVVNECLAEGQFVNNEQQQEQHQQQQEENIVYDSQSLETLYIPKAEKEEVIQYDTNESSIIIQTDPSTVQTDPGPNYTITDSIKPANKIYLQDDEQIIITEQNEEHHLIDQVPEAVGSDLKENEIRLEDAAMTEPVKEVYLAPEGIQLTELIQGLEETGAVVELRVDSDYDLPEGEPGQVIQVIGDDNKPVNLYYV